MCEPYEFHVDDGYHWNMAPVLVLASYLKRSRDAEPVKRLQQGGNRGKFWERFGERGKDCRFVTGLAEFFGFLPKRL
jgi:hypothetical protein